MVLCVCTCAHPHAHMHVYEVHMYVWCIYDIYAHMYEYIITQRQTPVSGVLYHCPPYFLKNLTEPGAHSTIWSSSDPPVLG